MQLPLQHRRLFLHLPLCQILDLPLGLLQAVPGGSCAHPHSVSCQCMPLMARQGLPVRGSTVPVPASDHAEHDWDRSQQSGAQHVIGTTSTCSGAPSAAEASLLLCLLLEGRVLGRGTAAPHLKAQSKGQAGTRTELLSSSLSFHLSSPPCTSSSVLTPESHSSFRSVFFKKKRGGGAGKQ